MVVANEEPVGVPETLWVNSGQMVYDTQRTWIDYYTAVENGNLVMTLGQDVLCGLQVFKNGLLLYPVGGAYTIMGRVITIPSVVAGDKIIVQYEYNADVNGVPASSDLAAILAQDNFNRANNSSSIGTAPSGQAWVNQGQCIMGINNNQAYRSSYTSGGAPNWSAILNLGSGETNVDVEVTLTTLDETDLGIVLRSTATGSVGGYYTTTVGLWRRINNTGVKIIAWSGLSAGDRIRCIAYGNSYACYKKAGNVGDWILLGTVINTDIEITAAHSYAGLRYLGGANSLVNYSNAGRFDDFIVRRALQATI